MLTKMAETNTVTIAIHASIPPSEEVAEALGKHLWELALALQKAGWKATVNLTMTKDTTDD
jgi:hypothetical protein